MTGGPAKGGISTFIESAKVGNGIAVREVEQDPEGALRGWVVGGVKRLAVKSVKVRVGDIARGKGLAVEAVAKVDEEPTEPDLTRLLAGIDTSPAAAAAAAENNRLAGADAVRFLLAC